MATTSDTSVSFEETDTRNDEMHSTIEAWIDDLVADVDEAKGSAEFQEWLDVQSRFHDYSHRNTLLINLQCPEATKVAGTTPGEMNSTGTFRRANRRSGSGPRSSRSNARSVRIRPATTSKSVVSTTRHRPRNGPKDSSDSSPGCLRRLADRGRTASRARNRGHWRRRRFGARTHGCR